ncbi:hypothetical protein GCM10020256_30210 [Streptomyces thermocoprophilus]
MRTPTASTSAAAAPTARPRSATAPHYCLGAALARVEMQEGIARMLARFPGLRFDGPDLDDVPLASNLFTFYPAELPVRI